MKIVLYIHGKGGNAAESTHYEKLFPDCKVNGLIEKAYFISPVVNMEKLIWKNDSAYHQNDCTNQDATVYDSLHDAVGIIFSFENPSIPAAVQINVNSP